MKIKSTKNADPSNGMYGVACYLAGGVVGWSLVSLVTAAAAGGGGDGLPAGRVGAAAPPFSYNSYRQQRFGKGYC